MRSITEECLSQMIFIGQASLRCAYPSTSPITKVSGITVVFGIGYSCQSPTPVAGAARSGSVNGSVEC